jgi:hypothetical protein
MNRGAPGGCPTCNLNALEINSPQSHKLTVGSMVSRYTAADIINTIHPFMLLISLNLVIAIELINNVITE